MAIYYVYSGATGTGDGSSWANAYTTVAAAMSAHGSTNTFYVSQDHLETGTGDITFCSGAGSTGVGRVICVNRSGNVPPQASDMTTGAIIRTTGNIIVTNDAGSSTFDGITFKPAYTGGSGTAGIVQNTGLLGSQFFYNCTFDFTGSTNAGCYLFINQGTYSEFFGCQLKFAGTPTRAIYPTYGSTLLWDGQGATPMFASGSTSPAALIGADGGLSGLCTIRNTDLSGLGSNNIVAGSFPGRLDLIACKIPSGVVPSTEGGMNINSFVRLFGCDSGGAIQRTEIWQYERYITTENTIVRTGGANDGLNAFSWKIGDWFWNKPEHPKEAISGRIWNEVTGVPKTLTAHIMSDGVTRNSDDIWLEVDYLGTAGSVLATTVTNRRVGWMTVGTNHPSDSGTAWTTTGLGTPVKQSMSVTFTPQQRGPIRWRVCTGLRNAAADPTFVYVCPKADLS